MIALMLAQPVATLLRCPLHSDGGAAAAYRRAHRDAPGADVLSTLTGLAKPRQPISRRPKAAKAGLRDTRRCTAAVMMGGSASDDSGGSMAAARAMASLMPAFRARVAQVNDCSRAPPLVPLVIDGCQLGTVSPRIVEALSASPPV